MIGKRYLQEAEEITQVERMLLADLILFLLEAWEQSLIYLVKPLQISPFRISKQFT